MKEKLKMNKKKKKTFWETIEVPGLIIFVILLIRLLYKVFKEYF